MESLKELNRICQKSHYKTVGNWMVRNILREAALPVTWLLLHTPVTANQVTLAALIIGLTGVFFLAIPGSAAFALGIILLQLWYFLDHVDGQIARYRKTQCLTGRFFDFLMHHLIHTSLFFSFGLYLAWKTDTSTFMLIGFISSLAMTCFNMIHDIKAKTYLEAILVSSGLDVTKEPAQGSENSIKTFAAGKTLYSFIHKSCEIHVVMNALTLLGLLEWALPGLPNLRIFAAFYYLLIPLPMTLLKIYFLICYRKIDAEFGKLFQIRP